MQGADKRVFLMFHHAGECLSEEQSQEYYDELRRACTNLLKKYDANPNIDTENCVYYPVTGHNFKKGWGESWKERAAQTQLETQLAGLTEDSELVIIGHGPDPSRVAQAFDGRVVGISPRDLAVGLCDHGLVANCRINIITCNAGRSYAFSQGSGKLFGQDLVDALQNASAEYVGTGSFAYNLQLEMFARHDHSTKHEIHARTLFVGVNDDGTKKTERKMGVNSNNDNHQRPHSKIIFMIDEGGNQTMKWAYT